LSEQYLREVPEAGASGRVAELYADIRAVLGLPLVNLVYRHLAVDEEQLAAVWAALRPNLGSRVAAEAGDSLVRLAAPSAAVLPRPVALDGALVVATLDAYARGNSRNLLGMHALLDGCPGNGERTPAPLPASGATLPMAELDGLATSARAVLDETAALLVGTERPVLVPSLLRHFAHDEGALAAVRDTLCAHAHDLASRSRAVAAQARRLAAGLPARVDPLEDDELRGVASRFVAATSSLLVAGETIRAALVPKARWAG